MTNWAKEFANALIDPEIEIYSNIDPAREYDGGNVLEIDESEPVTTTFISGKTTTRRTLAFLARSKTRENAEAIAVKVRDVALALANANDLEGFVVERLSSATDERGIVEGESFTALVEVSFNDKEFC